MDNSRRSKRRKTSLTVSESSCPPISFEPLYEQLLDESGEPEDLSNAENCYDNHVDEVLSEYLQDRASLLSQRIEQDDLGTPVRPLTRAEVTAIIDLVSQDNHALTVPEGIALRKLKLGREQERRKVNRQPIDINASSGLVDGLVRNQTSPTLTVQNAQVLDALLSIRSTPYENTFLSRLHSVRPDRIPGLIAVDWELESPWMKLMNDIHEHYKLRCPDRDHPQESRAAIAYTSLQSCHLDQVHELLARSFWSDIDVSDSLDYSPGKCTVIASYKKLVVGVAIMSSPRETYITYLAVRSGWDNSQIAKSMLYHLISSNPGRDIILHVSANNPAMLLYNQFGFKAEEFIVGFYERYLDSESRTSKNAFRLRLRRG
ncbi:hypothetical protein D9758_008733 [Tetrapyrgos nigripes]|uniref:N-acetyltransferase domain-containing protein n=1 Tax=Tetrapyrgos nigripes TaxID=182062 RepID=A0A8H5D3U9_9AGAR|nr:hypothetical protein D9758_008733 [Tetrapyrgos nigripes]